VTQNSQKILSKNLFPVVGVGASAGGLEAFKRLIKAIPENSGIAYILVQHLFPDHSSALPEILQRETQIRVNEITDNVKVQPNQVYIIPANKILIANDGILKLSPRPKDQNNMPIDIFFSSLAEVHQSHAIGVVLSGTGKDGTLGLMDIKDHGGIAFAQDLDSASYEGMPKSAIQSGVVDFILSPEAMPGQLLQLKNTFNLIPSSEDAIANKLTEEKSFKQILSILRMKNGIDFTYYKQTTIQRCILRRMVILKFGKLSDYEAYLIQEKTEQDKLFQDVLIPATTFFRDPKVFQHICQNILPELTKNKSSDNPLRIWVAGCSVGKEAYSIGMCLHEFLGDKISNFRIQIFATDVSDKSISRARIGVYEKSETGGLSEERLIQFFTKTNGNYQIKKAIRDMCVFAAHNFLKDPPFSKIDFISCRNVLIYFEPFLQKKAFTVFHYALNPKGYLWLGKAESIGGSSELFVPTRIKDKIYIRKSFPKRFMHVAPLRGKEIHKDSVNKIPVKQIKTGDFGKDADNFILAEYSPPGVIVNDQLDIVQFRGSTGDFLMPQPGKASLNILKMAREDLSFEIRNALQHSKTTKGPYLKQGISISNGKQIVSIQVAPLVNSLELYYLILFKDTTFEKRNDADGEVTAVNVKDQKDLRNQQLQKDLSQVREDMRAISEEQGAVNEELQSANEELLSGSEELQSLNEELETSRDELQSTNEELLTVNQELSDRNEQYDESRLYAEAIVSTINEPLVVIGHDFKIKSANKSFYKNCHLTEEETIGSILFDLQNKGWDIPILRSKLLQIQTANEKFIEWEVTHSFPVTGRRTIRFNAQPFQKENGEHWILLAMDDITSQKLARKKLEDSEGRFRSLVEKATFPICILKGIDMILEVANEPVFSIWKVGKEALGKPFLEIVPEMKDQPFMGWLLDVFRTGITHHGNEVPAYFTNVDGEKVNRYFNFVYQAFRETDGTISGVMVTASDVTEQVVARKRIEESEARFRQIAELMPAKIIIATAEGAVTYYNKKWLDFTGMNFEELKDFGYHKITHPDELKNFQKNFQKAAEKGNDLEMEMRFKNKDGNYIWHINRASPIKDKSGKIKMWIGTSTDIHDQKAKEHAKDEFIGIASHELKTPLTTAKAYIQLLEMSMAQTNDKDLIFAQKAGSSIDRLNDLIGELMDVTRIQNGKLNLRITEFDFNEMIADAMEQVQYASSVHRIKLLGKIKTTVTGDKNRLGQVVINLLSNAVKYSPKSTEVFIQLSMEAGAVKVGIQDSGIGIRKENLDKIFERYYREEQRVIHFQGLGIGLFISHEIIQRHHGKIWVESKPGKGSTFFFTIPLSNEASHTNA